MAEYIEREWLRRKVNSFVADVLCRGHKEMITIKDSCNPHEWTRGYERGALDIAKIIDARPTEDVVEVVRCKDCKHIRGEFCCLTDFYKVVEPEHYCGYGAKMDGKGDE